jgi:hypothetical protein
VFERILNREKSIVLAEVIASMLLYRNDHCGLSKRI